MTGAKHVALAFLLAIGGACAQAPAGRTCVTNGECPAGATCQEGVCQEGLALQITAPSGPVETRGTVAVQATVTGPQPPSLQLLVDDAAVATLAPPFTYALDTASLAEGSHTLAVAVEAGGKIYRSAARALVVDRTPPAVPAVAAWTTSAANPVAVTGTADAGVTVAVYEGATQVGTATAGAGGNWSAQVTLGEGTHGLTATAADVAGNVSSSSPSASVVVDRTAPAAPAVASQTTNAANPVPVTGTAEPGAAVSVYEAGVLLTSDVHADALGAWSTTIAFVDGTHALTAAATDAAGNTSPQSAAASVVVDRSAGISPTVNPVVTNANPVVVTGSAQLGSTVTVYEGVRALVSGAAVGPTGSWSAQVSLAEGSHSLTATATDASGNVSPQSAAASVVVDRTAPAVPAVAGRVTNAANPVPISGTAEPGASATVYEGSTQLGSGYFASPGGNWTGTVSLAEGSHTLTATAADAAGNVSATSAGATVVVDRTAPAAPAVASQTTNAANPVPVSGTAEAGASVAVYEAGTQLGAGFVANGAGAWSGAVTLAAGSHTLTATATDAAGNVSALSAGAAVVVDRTALNAPTVNALLTNDPNPVTVTGTAEAGSTVTLYENGTQLGQAVVATADGSWSAPVSLAEGTYALTATATDAAGNVSARSAAANVVVDRTAPAAPFVTPQTTNAASWMTVTVAGGAEIGSSVTLYEGGALLASGVVTSGNGTWFAYVSGFGEGVHSLTARATDAAGNVSGLSAPSDLTVDRTAPIVTATVPANGAPSVWSRDAITVTFSKQMQPASATAASVLLTGSGGVPLQHTVSFSPDYRVLTITPITLPPVPNDLTVTLTAGLTDWAENGLANPQSIAWHLPEWQDLPVAWTGGTNTNIAAATLSLAVGATGSIAVTAYSMGQNLGGTVAWYAGGAWTPLPPPAWGLPSAISVALEAGDLPAAVWENQAGDVQAARWSGTAWSTVETLDIAQADAARRPSVALDATGVPYAAWVETRGTIDQVFARRWNGSTWAQLGSGPLSSATVPAAAPVALPGATRVTWTETDATPTTTVCSNAYASNAWGGTPFAAALSPALAGASPTPLVNAAGTAYVVPQGTTTQVYRWMMVPISTWLWGTVGSAPLNTGAARSQTMVLDPSGVPIVAWSEGAGFFVRRWDATTTTWTSLTATPVLVGASRPVLAVGPTGIIAIAQAQAGTGPNPVVAVLRYNR